MTASQTLPLVQNPALATPLRTAFLFLLLALSAVILFLTGCQAKSEYWLNPDGSGKVTLDYSYRPRPDQCTSLPADLAAQAELRSWTGIDQWTNLKFTPDGAGYHLKATGYFKDIREVHSSSTFGVIRPHVCMTDGNVTSVGLVLDPSFLCKPAADDANAPNQKPLAGPVDTFRDRCNRGLFNDMPFHEMELRMLRELRAEYIIHTPGAIKNHGRLDEVNTHTVRWVISGDRYMDYCIDHVRDDELAAKVVESHPKPEDYYLDPTVWAEFLKKCYGSPESMVATIDPEDTQLVDRQAELNDKTCAPYAKIAADAGLVPAMPESNDENQLASIDVAKDDWARPVIRGQTQFPVDGFIQYGQIVKLVDDNDTLVVPAPNQDTQLNITGTERGEGRFTRFNISLAMNNPPRKIKLLKGFLVVVRSDGFRKTALGPIEVQPGATTIDGSFLMSDVIPIINGGKNDEWIEEAVDGTKFIHSAFIHFEGHGETGGGGTGLFPFGYGYFHLGASSRMSISPTRMPVAKISVERLINPRLIKIPFELRNVSLE